MTFSNQHLRVLIALSSLLPFLFAPVHAQCLDAKITDSAGGASESFGGDAEVDGNFAVIGAPSHSNGVAYVYERTGSGWVKRAALTPSNAQANSFFGGAVAIHGDVVVVGAPLFDSTGPVSDTGAAYVFVKPGGGWANMTSETAKVVANDVAGNDQFGTAVSIHGDWVAVGSPYDNGIGSMYLFRKPGGGWTGSVSQSQKFLNGTGAHTGDLFGYSVAITEDWVVVGAPLHDVGATTTTNEGAAFMFQFISGFWTPISSPGTSLAAGATYGSSVDAFGATGFAVRIAVGSSGANMVYLYERSGSVWNTPLSTSASDAAAGDAFGTSVALTEYAERLVVSSELDDDAASNAGSIYIFEQNGAIYSETIKLLPSPGAATDGYGAAVSMSGDVVLVAARNDDTVASNAGAVYAYKINGVVGTQFCFCPSGPCSNGDTNAGCYNNSLNGAALTGCGTASIGSDDLILQANNLPSGGSVLPYMSNNTITAATFGDGLNCLGSTIYRFSGGTANGYGGYTRGPGLAAYAAANFGAGVIASGQTSHFQVWYRNTLGPCGSGSNVTNGLSVAFVP